MQNAIEAIKTRLSAKAATLGIQTIKVGYVQDLASGVTDYDALLVIPPKEVISKPYAWQSSVFDIKLYVIRLDEGANGEMSETERIEAWDELRTICKQLIMDLCGDPSNMRLADSPVTLNPDSGGADGLLPDRVVWIDATLRLEVNVCD